MIKANTTIACLMLTASLFANAGVTPLPPALSQNEASASVNYLDPVVVTTSEYTASASMANSFGSFANGLAQTEYGPVYYRAISDTTVDRHGGASTASAKARQSFWIEVLAPLDELVEISVVSTISWFSTHETSNAAMGQAGWSIEGVGGGGASLCNWTVYLDPCKSIARTSSRVYTIQTNTQYRVQNWADSGTWDAGFLYNYARALSELSIGLVATSATRSLIFSEANTIPSPGTLALVGLSLALVATRRVTGQQRSLRFRH